MDSARTTSGVVEKPKVLVVLGPTGSGKSALAATLAREFHGELISADSRQIYREMDIGTAKSQGVRERLVDVVNPNESFTLRDYQDRAFEAIFEAIGVGKLPIVVGGTGLYIDAVVENWDVPAVPPNNAARDALEARLQSDGLESLVRELETVDPETARVIDKKNPRRVIRALEVAQETGGSFVGQKRKGEPRFDVLKIGLRVSREVLAKRLQKRTHEMIEQGLIEETQALLQKYADAVPLLSGIGYREVIEYLNGKISIDKMEALIVQRSLQYARRQMTWWKRDASIYWTSPEDALERVKSWLRF